MRAPEGNVDLGPYRNVRAWLARIEALPGFVAEHAARPGDHQMCHGASSREADRPLGKGHKTRQRLDARQPRAHVAVRPEIDIAFRRADGTSA